MQRLAQARRARLSSVARVGLPNIDPMGRMIRPRRTRRTMAASLPSMPNPQMGKARALGRTHERYEQYWRKDFGRGPIEDVAFEASGRAGHGPPELFARQEQGRRRREGEAPHAGARRGAAA